MGVLILVAALNIFLAAMLRFAEKRTGFGRLPYWTRQILVGLLFGAAACLGTRFATLPTGGATTLRDVAPLCAGLLFGAPAGLLSGLIGGLHRWIFVCYGAGSYVQLASSIATAVAGTAAAVMRKYFFKNKYPTVFYGITISVEVEVVHMLLVLLTHTDDLYTAFQVVQTNSIPMILLTSVVVALAIAMFRLTDQRSRGKWTAAAQKKNPVVPRRLVILLGCGIAIPFVIMTAFIFFLQTLLAESQVQMALSTSLDEVVKEVDSQRHPQEMSSIDDTMDVINNYHIHLFKEGELIAVDEDMNWYNSVLHTTNGEKFPLSVRPGRVGRLNKTEYHGQKIYYMYRPISDHYLVATATRQETMFFRNVSVYLIVSMGVVLFSQFFFGSCNLLRKRIMKNIQDANSVLTEIIGEPHTLMEDEGGDCFVSLLDELNHTVGALDRHSRRASARFSIEQANTRKFQHAAEHDPLTGLLNRNGFERQLAQMERTAEPVAFLYMDVDLFKEINDGYGHDTGDLVLQEVAETLRQNLRSTDILVRLGGDEFAVLLRGCTLRERDMILKKANQLNKKFQSGKDGLPPFSLSIGAAFSDQGYTEQLSRRADAALYTAKENGRSQCVFDEWAQPQDGPESSADDSDTEGGASP